MEVPCLRMADESLAQRVVKMLDPLVISSSKCGRMVKVLEQEIELGLEKGLEGRQKAACSTGMQPFSGWLFGWWDPAPVL